MRRLLARRRRDKSRIRKERQVKIKTLVSSIKRNREKLGEKSLSPSKKARRGNLSRISNTERAGVDTGITNPTTAKRDRNVVGDKASRSSPEDKAKTSESVRLDETEAGKQKHRFLSLSKQTHTSLFFFFFDKRGREIERKALSKRFLESFFTFLMKHYLAISFFCKFYWCKKIF